MILYQPPYQLSELKVEVTQYCPLNCIHCSSLSNPDKSQHLREDKVNEIISDSFKLGVRSIAFSGGEPLTWQAIYSVINQCKKLNIQSVIYTTGISSEGLNDDVGFFAKELKKSGLHRAIFSLYGASSLKHDHITRVDGSFESTVRAIKAFKNFKISCELHFVPLKYNYKELRNLVDLASRLGIKKVSLLRFVPHGRGILLNDIGPLSKDENLQLKKEIVDLINEKKIDIRLGSPYNILALRSDVYCKAGIDRLIINPLGKVYPCDAFKNIHEKDDYGSVLDYSLDIIWEKSEYLNKVRKYLASDYAQICRSCTELPKCKSGCLAQKVIKNRNFKKDRDPDCLFH